MVSAQPCGLSAPERTEENVAPTRQAGGHWFEPSTAHRPLCLAGRVGRRVAESSRGRAVSVLHPVQAVQRCTLLVGTRAGKPSFARLVGANDGAKPPEVHRASEASCSSGVGKLVGGVRPLPVVFCGKSDSGWCWLVLRLVARGGRARLARRPRVSAWVARCRRRGRRGAPRRA
jgi:hypothetical protein